MRYFVFSVAGFVTLGMICAMQRIAIYNLQQENTKIRELHLNEFFREFQAQNKQATYVVNPSHSLPEPTETIYSSDVMSRIDMLLAHLQPESDTLPSIEWMTAVLAAAKHEILLLEYNSAHGKPRVMSIGHCTR